MKRILSASLVIGLLAGAYSLSGGQKPIPPELQVDVENRNPWTHLRMNNAPEKFQFVVVSDRTGGHRARIFSQAIEQINLLQPAFVVSVGDLIEGYTKDTTTLATQWKELQTYTHQLHMPFFYVPGNHDVANPVETDVWKERFGRRYYHFIYKDVLFLALNSDDPHENKTGKIGQEQIAYFQKILRDTLQPRWIFVCLHKPIWTQADLDTNGWLEIEKALSGRNYTVFAGHMHEYQKFIRQGMNYYQFATTGGGSRMRGLRYGEFDHIVWVTMKKEGAPVLANLMLDGIYPDNLKKPVTEEEGVIIYHRKPVHPVRGKVMYDGAPASNAQVIFWLPDPKDKEGKKALRVSNALVDADGSYQMSTYVPNDGLPEGEYKVTVTLRAAAPGLSGKPGPNLLPEKYATHSVTDLRATVKTGLNEFPFNLSK